MFGERFAAALDEIVMRCAIVVNLPSCTGRSNCFTIMIPSFARLLLIGCVLSPKAALGRLIPLYFNRASPTSTPSFQPSTRPSSQPTSYPSFSPSSRPSASLRPSSQPKSSTDVSTSTSSSFLTSEAMANPPFGTTFGLWEIISLSLGGILFCFIALGCNLVRKKRNNVPKEAEGDGRSSWLPSFWPGESSSGQPAPIETKKQSTLPPAEEGGDGWTSWIPYWPGDSSVSDGASMEDSVSLESICSASTLGSGYAY
eukprot:scaffold3626_cov69-Skeletonema_dohrnii-CCMP3373.AAC.3